MVTHEHPDHFDEAGAGRPGGRPGRGGLDPEVRRGTALGHVPGRVHTVGHGDAFTAAGFEIQVHGELHAVIHPDLPRVTNVGYLVDGGALFHPGDALTVPDHPVRTLMLPVMAPGTSSRRSSTTSARSGRSAPTTSTTPCSPIWPVRSTTARSASSAAPSTCGSPPGRRPSCEPGPPTAGRALSVVPGRL
ncbi:MBL fold metallo-hydrolase [Streptomyces sp. INA 01156]